MIVFEFFFWHILVISILAISFNNMNLLCRRTGGPIRRAKGGWTPEEVSSLFQQFSCITSWKPLGIWIPGVDSHKLSRSGLDVLSENRKAVNRCRFIEHLVFTFDASSIK